ncbi:MAG: hypothetical protein RBT69_05625 [Spirochaetia bacterium]|jgi:hypothetical protein|nr:hypothetical protein [Spirochaetia bacterium]
MKPGKNNLIYFDFADLLPDDNYLFYEFEKECRSSGYDLALINWGGSFPWNFDEKLSLSEHIHEKTITALNSSLKSSSFTILPVFPFLGGMDFILTYPSYYHLRLDKYCSALNIESAGALLLFNEIIDDYKSLTGNFCEAAFNLTAVSLLKDEKRMSLVAETLVSVLSSNPEIKTTYLVGQKKEMILVEKLKNLVNLDGMEALYINDFSVYDISEGEKKLDSKDKYDLKAASPAFFLPDSVKHLMENYNNDTKYAWQILRFIKSGLYKIKYSSSISSFNFTALSDRNTELVDLFAKIVKTTVIIKENLKGRLNKKNINLYFDSATGIIEKEIILIQYDMENIKSKISGGL